MPIYQRLGHVRYFKTYGSGNAESVKNINKPISPLYIVIGNATQDFKRNHKFDPEISKYLEKSHITNRTTYLKISVSKESIIGKLIDSSDNQQIDRWEILYYSNERKFSLDLQTYIIIMSIFLTIFIGICVWINSNKKNGRICWFKRPAKSFKEICDQNDYYFEEDSQNTDNVTYYYRTGDTGELIPTNFATSTLNTNTAEDSKGTISSFKNPNTERLKNNSNNLNVMFFKPPKTD